MSRLEDLVEETKQITPSSTADINAYLKMVEDLSLSPFIGHIDYLINKMDYCIRIVGDLKHNLSLIRKEL